jgi:hypothetical protein
MKRPCGASRVRVVCVLFFAALPLGWAGSLRAAETEATKKAIASILAADLQNHVNVLANDTLEGRMAGSRGGRAAAGYLAKEFERLKLKPAGVNGSYFQPFDNQCRNLLAMIEGSDPVLKQQVIVVGAHYDHVGYGNAQNSYGPIGRIHNGADDNASGVATLLELGEALMQLEPRPKRSILLALWDNEESGLWGSKHWLANPTVPLKQVPLAFNLDMVGRLRKGKLEVLGSRTAAGLREIVSRQNTSSAVILDFNWDMKSDSDHHPFFERNVPVLMMHTGLHEDYHRPSDDAERVNAPGMQEIARLLFRLVVDVADRPTLPTFRTRSRVESAAVYARDSTPLAQPPARLGVSWAEAEKHPEGILVTRVPPRTPAAFAGIKAGDRIVAFAGREVNDEKAFRLAVLSAGKEETITVRRTGVADPLELKLSLPGDPVRVGLSWRTDDGEPGVAIVSRVISGSLADLGGLKLHDRILRIGGHTFANGDEFLKVLNAQNGKVEIEVERWGQVQTLTVQLPPGT